MKVEDKIRSQFMEAVKGFLEEQDNDVLLVKTGTYSIPWVTEDGDEGFINLTFSIPKGQRGGDGYDGYEEAQNFALEQSVKAEAKAKREAEKAKKKAKDAEARRKKAEAKAKVEAEG